MFKKFFVKVYQNILISINTSRTAGYQINNVNNTDAELDEAMCKEYEAMESIASLDTVSAADKEAMSTLKKMRHWHKKLSFYEKNWINQKIKDYVHITVRYMVHIIAILDRGSDSGSLDTRNT